MDHLRIVQRLSLSVLRFWSDWLSNAIAWIVVLFVFYANVVVVTDIAVSILAILGSVSPFEFLRLDIFWSRFFRQLDLLRLGILLNPFSNQCNFGIGILEK